MADRVEHTPKSWIVCTPDDSRWYLSIEQDRTLIDTEHSIVAEVDLSGDGITTIIGEANARRIVACVNACAGISTEDLELGAVDDLALARAFVIKPQVSALNRV